MITKLLYIVLFMAIVWGSITLTDILNKRIKLNRWIVGASAPIMLISISIIFKNINPIIWNIILVIFIVLCIMFFELCRMQVEEKEAKNALKKNSIKNNYSSKKKK